MIADPLDRPLISVVIAAYNAAATLARCIDAILAQTYQPLELVIVDDGSTDDTPEILASHPARRRFTALRVENGGPSRARNLGVGHARGDLVAFFDADCLPRPRCVEALASALDDERVASVGGLQVSPPDDMPFGKDVQTYFEAIGFLTEYVRADDEAREAVETQHNPSCNVLYRRSAFEEIGGFDEGLWPGEDVDLDHRASLRGYRHRFQPRAIVEHYRSASPVAFRRMMSSYGRAQRLLVRRHGVMRTLHYLPPVTLAGLMLAAAGLWWRPRVTFLASASAAACVLPLLELRRRRSRLGPVFYRLFWLNVIGWLSGYLSELVKPKFRKEPSLRPPIRLSSGSAAS